MRFDLIALTCVLFGMTACSTEEGHSQSDLMSQSTQFLTFNSSSAPMAVLAESGTCAQGLPASTFVQSYCFNAIPAIELNVTGIELSRPAFCVATHLPGMAPEAAVLVVDMNGRYVSEVTGSGARQMIDLLSKGRYRLYVGFPTSVVGQKATIRIAATSQFSLQAPACSLR